MGHLFSSLPGICVFLRARLGAPSTPPEVPEGTVLGVQEHEGNPRRKWRALAARMDPHRPLRQGSNHRWIQGLTTPLLLSVGCDGQGRSLAREGSGPQQRAARASIFSPGHFSVSPCTAAPGSWPPSAILPSIVCASNKRNLERARDFLSSTSVSLCWTEWKENEAKGGWGGGQGPPDLGSEPQISPCPGPNSLFCPLSPPRLDRAPGGLPTSPSGCCIQICPSHSTRRNSGWKELSDGPANSRGLELPQHCIMEICSGTVDIFLDSYHIWAAIR